MFRKSFLLKRRAAVSISAGALLLGGVSRAVASPQSPKRVRSNSTVLPSADKSFADARLAWRVRGVAPIGSAAKATISPARVASPSAIPPFGVASRAVRTQHISVAATAWETQVARAGSTVLARTPGNHTPLRATTPVIAPRVAHKIAKPEVRTTRLAAIVPPRVVAPIAVPTKMPVAPTMKVVELKIVETKPMESKSVKTSVVAPVKIAAAPVVAPKTRGPVSLSARHKDRMLLAQLEADLARSDRNLSRANADLSEGQKQLSALGGTLRSAMLEAGPDAKGLHPFVRVAQRYAGTPYVWGGESARGFDCSGFIIRVMRDLGYKALPHSAAEQFNYGMPVANALLKPGDLVFFANTYKPGVSHVGIYLGRRRFIHAAGTGQGTIVSSLDAAKFRAKYAGARRLIAQ